MEVLGDLSRASPGEQAGALLDEGTAFRYDASRYFCRHHGRIFGPGEVVGRRKASNQRAGEARAGDM